MLEQEALARMLEQLRTEQAAAEADLVVLQRRVNSLRQAVAGIEGLLDTKPTPEGSPTAAGTGLSPEPHSSRTPRRIPSRSSRQIVRVARKRFAGCSLRAKGPAGPFKR
jgi:hypothetical protein